MEERKFMDACNHYLIVDPLNYYGPEWMNTKLTEEEIEAMKQKVVVEAEKRFMSIFRKKPEQTPFWCYGYEVACAGPIPEK